MKQIKLKNLWTLDIEINGQMIQVFSSRFYFDCAIECKKYKGDKTSIQKRKVLTDKY